MHYLVKTWLLLLLVVFSTATPAKPSDPQKVEVSLYVLNIGKLDPTTGTFSVDFYLGMKSDRPVPETFEFLNGRAQAVQKISDEGQGKEKYFRILANLTSPLDYRKFPFDQQRLYITLEDSGLADDKLIYTLGGETGLDEAVVFPGWTIAGHSAKVDTHLYKVFDESYSRYVYEIEVNKIPLSSFMKTFLPVLFTMLIMVSSFILNPSQIVTRLATISSSLVATVMFHVALGNQLPPVPYLTFADEFMFLTYGILLVSFFLNIGIFVLSNRNNEGAAKRLSKASEVIVFIGVPISYLLLFALRM